MPRKSRPKNNGPGGNAYGQRTDLTQAPKAPTGMAYGAHKETVTAQQALPLPQAPSAPGPSPGAAGPGGAAGIDPAMLAALGTPPPGMALNAATTRPMEPVQSGLPTGPGPGPEVLQMQAPRAADYFDRLATNSNNPAMAELAALARRMGA